MNDQQSKKLYRAGAASSVVVAALLVGEVAVYASFQRPETALEHFRLFQDNWLIGLLTLDLLGMVAYLLFIPIVIALYVALRREGEAMMAIATVLFVVGIADFFATNNAFSVLTLSNQYAGATTEAEREMFLTAGQAMFTMFNENAFLVSYVLVSASWTLIAAVMLRGSVFSRTTGRAGVLAGAAGIVAVILEHVTSWSAVLDVAIGFYFAAIVALFIWIVLTGQRLRRLAADD